MQSADICVKMTYQYKKMVKKKMKKILCLVLALSVFVSCAVFSSAAEKGDIDRDGEITSTDARLALRISVNLEAPDEEQSILADYDEDGAVSAADARAILRASVGLFDEAPTEKEEYVPSEQEELFYTVLYEIAHPFLGQHKVMFDNAIMKNFQKWCCLYTIGDVFRPALEKAGYSKEHIDLVAPNKFSRDSVAKILSNVLNISWPDWFIVDLELYVPSLLCDYYIKTPEAAETFFLYDFYDDMVETKLYEHSEEDRSDYVPRIGDVLFIANKQNTSDINKFGYPTVAHTAQIIEIYEDGSFLCTEGSLVESYEGDDLARVRERKYRFNKEVGTYEFTGNPNVVVLMATHPAL